MSQAYIRFGRWTGGDFGRVDAGMAPDDSWSGSNVQMYPSGLIGPRWGLKAIDVAGSLTVPNVDGPRGFATIGPNVFIVTDRLRYAPLTGLSTASLSTTAFATYPTSPTGWITIVGETSNLVYSLNNNILYQHSISGLTTTAVTTPANFSFVRRWGLYCVGVDDSVKYRLWFSEVTDSGFTFNTWPANNYYDIGDAEPITAIVPIHNTLYVGKRSGWWAITGVVGVSISIRQVSTGDGPVDARGATATADNRVAYWPKSPNPAYFNGSSSLVLLDHVTTAYNPTAAQAVASSPTGRTVLFGYDSGSSSSALLLASLGSASYHTFAQRLAGFAPDVIENGYGLPAGYVLAVKQASIAGEALAVYAWRIDPDRPPLPADTLGSYGDASSTPLNAGFTTRAVYDSLGRDIRVRSITVRLRAWGIGSGGNKLQPGFGVSVQALSPHEDTTVSSETQYWRIPYGQVASTGQDLTARFAIGDQGYGAGFRVSIEKMVGVAVRDIVVGVDYRDARP